MAIKESGSFSDVSTWLRWLKLKFVATACLFTAVNSCGYFGSPFCGSCGFGGSYGGGFAGPIVVPYAAASRPAASAATTNATRRVMLTIVVHRVNDSAFATATTTTTTTTTTVVPRLRFGLNTHAETQAQTDIQAQTPSSGLLQRAGAALRRLGDTVNSKISQTVLHLFSSNTGTKPTIQVRSAQSASDKQQSSNLEKNVQSWQCWLLPGGCA